MSTQTVKSQAASAPLPLPATSGTQEGPLYPGIIVNLSAGASLTYNVEATGDNATWAPISSGATAATASATFGLQGKCLAVRANVTTYASGTLTISLVA